MAATVFGSDEIIILLGAGASVEAGIPDSNKMVQEIERLVANDSIWSRFKDLYNYVRSSIFYADGLNGIFGENVPFNIERLVNVLNELQEKERHTLYPFVGAWNPKLQETAGAQFEHIQLFQREIICILRNQWIALSERDKAAYYGNLLRFQNEYEFPLRVFSLNYDLCVEETCGYEKIQRGFITGERTWNWRAFEETSEDARPLALYKLHGSADWCFADDGRVLYLDSPSSITDENVAVIFGTSYKLQYIDPFLFLTYELRRWTLDAARVIVCIGYGFNDEHINGILRQALRQDAKRKLLAVVGPGDKPTAKKRIVNQLDVTDSQVEASTNGAKEFLENHLTLDALAELFPVESDLFPEASDTSELDGHQSGNGF